MDGSESGESALREVMGSYPTGVTIVAGCDEAGEPFGLTVNSFTSVSLDPPLVLVCIGRASASHDRLVSGSGFSVNVLSGAQGDIAWRCAREPSEGRFDDVAWTASSSGAPILDGAAAWLDCAVHEVLEGGDHSIVLGRVVDASVSDLPALLFHRGRLSSTDP
jgi:flavin reductase (DIM6/NTAB) family NADH-FMN oxidoreductase RutF